MAQKVRKAVLPVAGLGTRFLPATKAMPKEMLTVVDKPVIQYAVEEAVAAGIEEIIFVTGRGKTAIENHFDRPYELADQLEKKGKLDMLDKVVNMVPEHVRFFYTRQGQPKGLGHAVNCAASLVGDEPFAVLLPDDIITSNGNPLKDMVDIYEETDQSVVMVEQVAPEKTKSYGILDVGDNGVENSRVAVKGLVEKPSAEEAPSNLGVVGRYVLSPRHFHYLSQEKVGSGGEIQLTDAMNEVCAEEGFYGYVFDGHRFDCGDKVGFQQANLYFAMKDAYVAEHLLPFLQKMAEATDRRCEPRTEEQVA